MAPEFKWKDQAALLRDTNTFHIMFNRDNNPSRNYMIKRSDPLKSRQSRREFAKLTLGALACSGLAPLLSGRAETRTGQSGKPDSKVAGVQLGLNVPYSFGKPQMSGEEILQSCALLGISAVELRTQPVEAFLGAPAAAAGDPGPLRRWRQTASLERVKEFRAHYEGAGVKIEIVKVDGMFTMTDGELDYAFDLAKALGGRAISTEISHEKDALKRVGGFADKHRFMVGYHGHATTTPEHWETAFSLANHNGANVDLGHFVAGNNCSPVPFIQKHHQRITHVHLKDRKFHDGPNTPFGQGDTPIIEVLQLLRDKRWEIQATIEFEYKVPSDSDRMKEIARALAYCRKALT